MLKTKQKARGRLPLWCSPQPSRAQAGAKNREGPAVRAGLPSGWPDSAIIHYLLGVAQATLFDQGISGESRVHLGLPRLLCPCSERFLLHLQRRTPGWDVGPGPRLLGSRPLLPRQAPSLEPLHRPCSLPTSLGSRCRQH